MSVSSFLEKLNSLDNYTFVLPFLKEEVKYRKLDIIEGSIDGSMPNFIATEVLKTMKGGLTGEEKPEFDVEKISDDDVKDLLVKATSIWQKAVIEPKLSIDQIVRIPAEDRIAWFLEAVSQSHTSKTISGGEVSIAEVATFPENTTSRRNSKRSSDS